MPAHAHVHADGRVHGHDSTPALARAAPPRSLLRLSLGGRLAIAGCLVAAIWLAVAWAIG